MSQNGFASLSPSCFVRVRLASQPWSTNTNTVANRNTYRVNDRRNLLSLFLQSLQQLCSTSFLLNRDSQPRSMFRIHTWSMDVCVQRLLHTIGEDLAPFH